MVGINPLHPSRSEISRPAVMPAAAWLSAAAAWTAALEGCLGVRVRALPAEGTGMGDGAFCRALQCRMPVRPQCARAQRTLQRADAIGAGACPFGFGLLGRSLVVDGACVGRIEVGPFRLAPAGAPQVCAALQAGVPSQGANEDLVRIYLSTPLLPPRAREGVRTLLDAIAQAVTRAPAGRIRQTARPEAPPVAAAREFIAQHLEEPLGVARLAAQAGLSPDHFARVFKQTTGTGVTAYVNRLRLEKAGGLLASTGRRVADIAYECGFESVPHFNRMFHRLMGMSPTAHRLRATADLPEAS